jgi:hypothetical protein
VLGFIAFDVFCKNPSPSDVDTILNTGLCNYGLELVANGTVSGVVEKQDEDDELIVIPPNAVSNTDTKHTMLEKENIVVKEALRVRGKEIDKHLKDRQIITNCANFPFLDTCILYVDSEHHEYQVPFDTPDRKEALNTLAERFYDEWVAWSSN